jgi:hypothetical protein
MYGMRQIEIENGLFNSCLPYSNKGNSYAFFRVHCSRTLKPIKTKGFETFLSQELHVQSRAIQLNHFWANKIG